MASEHGLTSVTATLELYGDADPPEGRVVAGGATYEFCGWLGLALALEEAIEAARQTAPPGESLADEKYP